MNESEYTVADGIVVSMAYVLRSDDSQVIDRAGADDPFVFLQGQKQIIPGLENELYGMSVGQEKDIVVTPEDGYGPYDNDNVDIVPRSAFPADMKLEEGMGLRMRDSNTNELVIAYVAGLQPDAVVLDLNHPLAGETLHFHVKIVDLRMATPEELDHGHVHGAGHAH